MPDNPRRCYNGVTMFQKDFQSLPPGQLARPLLRWFDTIKRDLPWRGGRDPYAIWVSEIMLQQTQVVTVVPYYERFLTAFPTVAALAASPLDEVLRLWEGLGYYSRARHLHHAAQLIVAQQGGQFPRTLPEALALPGVGRYTAGAILSIAYGLRLPALDGNALRVLSRVLWLPGGGRRGEEKRRVEDYGAAAVSPTRPGDYNQALMELGALVCLPKTPQCPHCPLRRCCLARRRGEPEAIPHTVRTPLQKATVVAALVRRRGRVLLAQRPPEGVWAGLWELPNESLEADAEARATLLAYLEAAFGIEAEVGEALTTLTHGLMNRRITLTVYEAKAARETIQPQAHVQARWFTAEELAGLALPAPHRKALRRLLSGQDE